MLRRNQTTNGIVRSSQAVVPNSDIIHQSCAEYTPTQSCAIRYIPSTQVQGRIYYINTMEISLTTEEQDQLDLLADLETLGYDQLLDDAEKVEAVSLTQELQQAEGQPMDLSRPIEPGCSLTVTTPQPIPTQPKVTGVIAHKDRGATQSYRVKAPEMSVGSVTDPLGLTLSSSGEDAKVQTLSRPTTSDSWSRETLPAVGPGPEPLHQSSPIKYNREGRAETTVLGCNGYSGTSTESCW